MRIIVLFFSMIFTMWAAQAQRFDAGAIAGASTSQVSGDRLAGYDKVGLNLGGFVVTSFSDKISFGFELTYIQKGSRKNSKPEQGDFTAYLLKLNYAEVPMLVKFRYNNRFEFEAGPSIGVLLGSKEEDENGTIPVQIAFEKYDLSLAAGMNYYFTDNLFLNSRISNSILPVRPHESGAVSGFNRGQYNSVLAFTLRYQFNKAE